MHGGGSRRCYDVCGDVERKAAAQLMRRRTDHEEVADRNVVHHSSESNASDRRVAFLNVSARPPITEYLDE